MDGGNEGTTLYLERNNSSGSYSFEHAIEGEEGGRPSLIPGASPSGVTGWHVLQAQQP